MTTTASAETPGPTSVPAASGPRNHRCLCHDTDEQVLTGLLPFVTEGWRLGEQCVCLVQDPARSPLVQALRMRHASEPGVRARPGALVVFDGREIYRHGGTFDPDRMLSWVRGRLPLALAEGYSGTRLVGEMATACGAGQVDADRISRYEVKLNDLAASGHVSAFCAYDLARFSPRAIVDAVETHPEVVVDGTVCANPHFVPPELFLKSDWRMHETRLLLQSLRRLQLVNDQLEADAKRRRQVWQRLLEQQELERRAFARDLHDDLGQVLTAIHLRLQETGRDQRGAPALAADGPLPDADALLVEAMESVRTLSFEARPSLLDDLGLAAALRSLARRQARYAGFEVVVDVSGIEGVSLPRSLESTCFRLVLAALTNVVRHAAARKVQVQVLKQGGALAINVTDDGHGFDVSAARARAEEGHSVGLLGMEERAFLAGGGLVIESTPGRGSAIRALLPLPDGAGA